MLLVQFGSVCIFQMISFPTRLRKMADNAFEYASKNNLIRTNEIHQEQEAKLVLEDGFTHEQIEGEETTSKTNMVVDDSFSQQAFMWRVGSNLILAPHKVNHLCSSNLRILMAASWKATCPAVLALPSFSTVLTEMTSLMTQQRQILDLSSYWVNVGVTFSNKSVVRWIKWDYLHPLHLGWPSQPSKRTARPFQCYQASLKYVAARSTKPNPFWTAHGLLFQTCLCLAQTYLYIMRWMPTCWSNLHIIVLSSGEDKLKTIGTNQAKQSMPQMFQSCRFSINIINSESHINSDQYLMVACHNLSLKACRPTWDPVEPHDGCLHQARRFAEGVCCNPQHQAWTWWCIHIYYVDSIYIDQITFLFEHFPV